MNFKIVKMAATDKRLTGMHMRVFMLLSASKLLMQSKLAELLSAKKQNINKIVKELEMWGYIKVHSMEGKNKFFTISNDINKIESIMMGQMDLFKEIIEK